MREEYKTEIKAFFFIFITFIVTGICIFSLKPYFNKNNIKDKPIWITKTSALNRILLEKGSEPTYLRGAII
jgi:hypothetical protein